MLPKDIVKLIMVEYAPFMNRSVFAIRVMVEFIWNHWTTMERLIHERRKFKVIHSQDGKEIRFVRYTGDKWEEVVK